MATFGGQCPSCGQGVAIVAPYGQPTPCPACGVRVRLGAVQGTYSHAHGCDDACLYARGPKCVCQCGGEGHMMGWVVDLASSTYAQPIPATVVAKVAKGQAAKAERKAAKEAAKAKAEADYKALQVGLFAERAPEVQALLTSLTEQSNPFLHDLARTLSEKGTLSPRACEIALQIAREDAAKAARLAAQPKAAPVVLGKAVEVTGEVLSIKREDPYTYGAAGALKMLVLDARGFKVYGTCPGHLSPACEGGVTKGCMVSFTAEVVPGWNDDPTFGKFLRPKNAKVLAGAR